VEFAYLKIMHDGSDPVTGSTLVNPGVPIPADASKIHGITDSDVAGAPSLRELAPMISDLMRSCVVSGFNVRQYDVPYLQKDMARFGANLPHLDVFDVRDLWFDYSGSQRVRYLT